MGQRQHRSYHAKLRANVADVRVESLRGQEHVVVPVVMLVEGVIQGALAEAPELALASEFGSNPTAWNGCPVPVTHPKRNSQFVSAGTPDVWGAEVIGFLFNTKLVETSLCSELWINKEWAEESEYLDVLQALESGTVMEVSTGLFTDTVDVQGVWNGLPYRGVWTNCVPDHLALLPNDIGACSVEMGAGTNRTPLINMITAEQLKSQGSNARRLAAINQVCKEKDMPKPQKPSVFQRVLAAIAPTDGEQRLSAMEQALRDNLQGISDGDLRSALSIALAASKEDMRCCIIAVFDDRVVYEYLNDDWDWVMVQRGYSIDAAGAGKVNLMDDIVAVRPMTAFVPVLTESEMSMVTEKAAKAVAEGVEAIHNNQGPDVETPAAAVEEPPVAATATEPAAEPAPAAIEEPAVNAAPQMPVFSKTDAANLFGADEQSINEALALRAQQKASLVQEILGAKGNSFNVEELNAFTIQQLNKMAEISRVAVSTPASVTPGAVDFSASSGAAPVKSGNNVIVPLQAWPRKVAGSKS